MMARIPLLGRLRATVARRDAIAIPTRNDYGVKMNGYDVTCNAFGICRSAEAKGNLNQTRKK
jgi:hypothetical protein